MLARAVAAAITSVNPDRALTFRPLADQVNAPLTHKRIVAVLSGSFGALALLLAGLGLYDVTSYAVTRRRTEIGIRTALGAPPSGGVRLVLVRVTLLVAMGVAAGAGVSVWASQFVAALLYGLEPRDPITLAPSAAVLAAVGALAGWLPAYRASRIGPAQVLRDAGCNAGEGFSRRSPEGLALWLSETRDVHALRIARSTLIGPAPAAAKYSHRKQYRTASSPWF